MSGNKKILSQARKEAYKKRSLSKPKDVPYNPADDFYTFTSLSIKPSKIHGKGLFANKLIKAGDNIMLSHKKFSYEDDGVEYEESVTTSPYSKMYNHNESNPNAVNNFDESGKNLYLTAIQDIEPGEEITTNYNDLDEPTLESPSDFGTEYEATSDIANSMMSEERNYDQNFMARGGSLNRAVLKDLNRQLRDPYRSKRYSKSLAATNSLFAPNYLFSKPSKRRLYNPNAKYFKHGGESHDPPEENAETQKEWMINYINSPMYLKRLSKEFPDFSETMLELERDNRLKNVENVKIKYPRNSLDPRGFGWIAGAYYPKQVNLRDFDRRVTTGELIKPTIEPGKSGSLYLEPKYRPDMWTPSEGYNTIPLHEIGHAADDGGFRIPYRTTKLIYDSTNKAYAGEYPNYDVKPWDYATKEVEGLPFKYENTPTEFVNRLIPLRYELEKAGIWKPGEEDFIDGMYNLMLKNPDIMKNRHVKDILEQIPGADDSRSKRAILTKLLNEIALNDVEQDLNVAKHGGPHDPPNDPPLTYAQKLAAYKDSLAAYNWARGGVDHVEHEGYYDEALARSLKRHDPKSKTNYGDWYDTDNDGEIDTYKKGLTFEEYVDREVGSDEDSMFDTTRKFNVKPFIYTTTDSFPLYPMYVKPTPPTKPTMKEAYKNVDKDKYPTFEDFKFAAEYYKENGENPTEDMLPSFKPTKEEIKEVIEDLPLEKLPMIKPSLLKTNSTLPEELEEDFNNDYKAKRVVDKETHYKVNKKGKIRRGPFGKKTTRRVRYELPEAQDGIAGLIKFQKDLNNPKTIESGRKLVYGEPGFKEQQESINKDRATIITDLFPKIPTSIQELETLVDESIGSPQKKARDLAAKRTEEGEDEQDNYRHATAGRLTAEAIQNKTGNIPYLSAGAGWLGSNILGIGHELSTLFSDDRPWLTKATEAAEDIYNNNAGASTVLNSLSPKENDDILFHKSINYILPDGYGDKRPFKDNQGWTDPYDNKEKDGGEILPKAQLGKFGKRTPQTLISKPTPPKFSRTHQLVPGYRAESKLKKYDFLKKVPKKTKYEIVKDAYSSGNAGELAMRVAYDKYNKSINGLIEGAKELIGTFKGKSGRSFGEVFPITKSQKNTANVNQNLAHKQGVDFMTKYLYGRLNPNFKQEGQLLNPTIQEKIMNIYKDGDPKDRTLGWKIQDRLDRAEQTGAPLFGEDPKIMAIKDPYPSYDNTNLNSNINPIGKFKNILTGGVRETLGLPGLTDSQKINIINSKWKGLLGVNYPWNKTSTTFKNKGPYRIPSKEIKETALHESGHTAEELGFKDTPISKVYSKYDSDRGYYYPNPDTKIGQFFEKVMPNEHWYGSPGELFAEKMAGVEKLYEDTKLTMADHVKHDGKYMSLRNKYTQELGGQEAYDDWLMDSMRNPTNEQLDYMIDIQNLNRFFKPGTSQADKYKALRYFPGLAAPFLLPGLTDDE